VILDRHLAGSEYVVGRQPAIADFSMMAYLSYPNDETGYDLAVSHSSVHAWLGRLSRLPGWLSPYDLLQCKRLVHFV
jgi:glutathione S-transferase